MLHVMGLASCVAFGSMGDFFDACLRRRSMSKPSLSA